MTSFFNSCRIEHGTIDMTRDVNADANNPLIQGSQVEGVSLLNNSSGFPPMNKSTIRHSKTFREKKKIAPADATGHA
jgi:hypothetical protein